MSGETDLDTLLASMQPELHQDTFVFATTKDPVPQAAKPLMIFQEAEGTTLILPESNAEQLGISYEFPCRMITLNIHSALDAVGFLARITSHLAKQEMGINPVSGFYHDHLFVPANRAEDAMKALEELSAETR